MAGERGSWTGHGPWRVLGWWPFLSFALVALFPDSGVLMIVAAGAALAVVALLGTAVARLASRRAPAAPVALPAAPTEHRRAA